MSTVDRTKPRTLQPLAASERRDRVPFHERYEAMPPSTRAELIGGVDYIPSPISLDDGRERVPVNVFPGLWLDPGALFSRDRTHPRAAVDRGVTISERKNIGAALKRARGKG
jgi:hypothetical protein